MTEERVEFGNRQAEMTRRWFENVKRDHGDVDAYIATRHIAYLDRWKEAGRFIADGADILDVGGGNLYESLIRYFIERKFRYNFVDVDWGAVDCGRSLAAEFGLSGASFRQGYNDFLDFADSSFDAVFTSHCIEHSIDLRKTLFELNRVLRLGGNLCVAVPFGWEANPEHPYFFGPAEWVALIEDAGFQIRVAQIGFEYPEQGADYFIAARKVSDMGALRLDPINYMKTTYTFVPHDDPSITYRGEFEERPGHKVSASADAGITITAPQGSALVLPIFHRHPWSGTVVTTPPLKTGAADLYSWFNYDMPLFLDALGDRAVRIELGGKAPMARLSQMVVKGYMWA